jgi:tol-pal system protein YbgF
MEQLEASLNSAKQTNMKASETLNALAKRLDEMDSSLAASRTAGSLTTDQISQLVTAMKAVETEINSLKKQQADSAREIEGMKLLVREEAEKKVAAAPEKETSDLETGEGRPSSSERPPADAAGTKPIPPGLSPEKIYQVAYGDYTKGNFDLAIEGFAAYLTSFPQGSLAANAQYWLGECYYSRREFARAVDEFDKVIKNYPKSAQAPSALLKKGYSHLELLDKNKGRQTLDLLIKRYPQSREATLAKERLRQIK